MIFQKKIIFYSFTLFPQIVSAETILFLNLAIRTVTFDHSKYVCGHYSREETIQGRKLFAEIGYVKSHKF